MQLITLIFLLVSFSVIYSSTVYRSCLDAVNDNNFTTDTYSIQPRIGGATSQVYCQFTSNFEVTTILDNNKETLTSLAKTQAAYGIKVNIQYENFDDSDLTELLKAAGVCQQTMRFVNRKAANWHNRFLFWDGSYTSFIANDGICNCLITQICEQTNILTKPCYPSIETQSHPVFDFTGRIAVLPQRLPLKRIEAGDTNDGTNKFSIGKLKCTRKMLISKKLIFDNKCQNREEILTDGNLQTCLTFKQNEFGFKLKIQGHFRFLNISNSNSVLDNIFVQSLKPLENDNGDGNCLRQGNLFKCSISLIGEYILYFYNMTLETEICEVEVLE
ncbi:unnamed protein product [Dimorphilus gyrociliatus]|uniref:Uncharacterized protein n=1 Tax=Dimorphilus gyrociliatus TaxID=2664684 RepID=A0A7I8WFP9_9ANNE|nr:unnamed protein product [Dimorphilus gyrociliatus]